MHITKLSKLDDAGNETYPGIQIEHLPASGKMRVHSRLITEYSRYMSVLPDKIVFHTVDGEIELKVLFPPGRHCLTCKQELPPLGRSPAEEAQAALECRDHVDKHGKKAVRNERWPHGYLHYPHSHVCEIVETDLTKRLMRR